MSSSSRRRSSRACLFVLLALLLCLVPAAIAVRNMAEPEPPQAATPEAEEVAEVEEAPVSPAFAPAPAPVPPRPTPRPDKELIKLPPIVLNAGRGLRANETAAIAMSRNVMSAQAQMQATGLIDEDGDGTGEFGTFAEMSGSLVLRGGTRPMVPPVLSSAFRKVDASGHVTRSGYVYAIYLPRAGGWGCKEQGHGGLAAGLVDTDLAEKTWCVYAWPLAYGKTGRRTYMANQTGDVVATDCATYSGANGPRCDAAFVPDPSSTSTIAGKVALGAKGNDGNVWKQVN
jgi:hypothetical protein